MAKMARKIHFSLFTFYFKSFAIPRTVAILAAAMSVDDDADTSEAHQVQAIQDIETLGDSAVLRTVKQGDLHFLPEACRSTKVRV